MSTIPYARAELRRTLRNRRFLIMSLGFPLVLYCLIAIPNRGVSNLGGTGLSAPLYYMVGLAAFGAMATMISSGTRIAAERSIGWSRQLRLTPLPARAYLRTKTLTAYVLVLLTLALLFAAGTALGVRLPAQDWVRMTWLMLVALAPFAALGVLLGHLLTSDSIGPVVGGFTAVLAFLGGTWFPLGNGVMNDIAQALPSYWLVQASHAALGGPAWPARGWVVVLAWTLGLVVLSRWAYRRDTQRA